MTCYNSRFILESTNFLNLHQEVGQIAKQSPVNRLSKISYWFWKI